MADDLAVKTIMGFVAGPSAELAVTALITTGFCPLRHATNGDEKFYRRLEGR